MTHALLRRRSVEISTSFPALHIAATYGLGEAVVSGEEFSDEFLLDPTDLKVIKRVKGSKRNEYRVRADRSGIEKVPVSKERQERCGLGNCRGRRRWLTLRRVGAAAAGVWVCGAGGAQVLHGN